MTIGTEERLLLSMYYSSDIDRRGAGFAFWFKWRGHRYEFPQASALRTRTASSGEGV